MEKGTYTGRRVDFESYTAFRFNPHLFVGLFDDKFGCGATALSLLTGVAPRIIAAANGSVHFPDKFVVTFLRRHRFAVQPLTLCNVSASKSRIEPQHVILLSQLFRTNEATWGVIFNGTYFHNFTFYHFDNLSLLNKPVLSAYLVGHSRWRPSQSTMSKPMAKPRLRHPKFTLTALGIRPVARKA